MQAKTEERQISFKLAMEELEVSKSKLLELIGSRSLLAFFHDYELEETFPVDPELVYEAYLNGWTTVEQSILKSQVKSKDIKLNRPYRVKLSSLFLDRTNLHKFKDSQKGQVKHRCPDFLSTDDFRHVEHKGKSYFFNEDQALVIKSLYERHELGFSEHAQFRIGLDTGLGEDLRIDKLFKQHSALGGLLVRTRPGERPATYKLNL